MQCIRWTLRATSRAPINKPATCTWDGEHSFGRVKLGFGLVNLHALELFQMRYMCF
jgi:hypothetical protein